MTKTMTLRRYNALYMHVSADDSILYTLREQFKFRPDGYKYNPRFRNGLWDGYIYLFNPTNCLFPTGLVMELLNWAIQNDVHIDIPPGTSINQTTPHLDSFLLDYSHWCKFEPYGYQLDAVRRLLQNNRGLCLSPTGSGKSMIVYAICRYLMEHTYEKILISVPTTQLVEQMVSDFEDYAIEGDPFAPHLHSHKIYAGKSHDTSKRIVVTTWQSVYDSDKSWLSRFGAYICDEAHQGDSKSITGMVNKMADTAQFRFGLTGTLNGTKCHEMQLRALFGSIVKTKTTRELMDEGVLATIDIRAIVYQYPKKAVSFPDDIKGAELYQAELEVMMGNEERMRKTLELALSRNHNTLVLFNYVEAHGIPMYERAKAIAAERGKEVFFIAGDTPVAERELIRAKFAESNNIVLFASYGTFSAGINVKNIHHLILAHPTVSIIRLLQSIGRSLRIAEGKTKAILYDLVDDFNPTRKTKKNILFKQFETRLGIYEAQEFDYSISQESLE